MKSLFSLLLAAAMLCCAPAWSQTAAAYPDKPLRLIVPFLAGSTADLLARLLAAKLAERLGQPVTVDIRPAAGGVIASDQVAKSMPDGYTLLLASSATHAVGPMLNARPPYDAARDFTPIVHLGNAPGIMLVPKASQVKSVREWIALARPQPGKLNYGSGGAGTIAHLTAELFEVQAGLSLAHIPYKDASLAVPDLQTGQLDVLFDTLPTGLPHVREGRLRALGVTSLQRSPLAPELPTIAETLPGFESSTWFGLYGPKALPADIVAKLNAAANQALADADARERLARLGIAPAGGTPLQLAQMAAADLAKWKAVVAARKTMAN